MSCNAAKLMTVTGNTQMKEEGKPPHLEAKGWISEEELYTEGSSDEDDMALSIKRREQNGRDWKKAADDGVPGTRTVLFEEAPRRGAGDDNSRNIQSKDEDDAVVWRPTRGSSKMKTRHSDLDKRSAAQCEELPKTEPNQKVTLSEAYSSMHRLDALLKESDKKVKVAQAETLRAQLWTRSQLRQLRQQGGHSMALPKNWEAFMELCPAPLHDPTDEATADGVPEDSVLSRITEHSDDDSEDGNATDRLAITDDEKLRLSKLLRDVDSEGDLQQQTQDLGFTFDAEARRCLEDIDKKLQELQSAQDSAASSASPEVSAGATRRQRLQDIDRCLEALAAAAQQDVEPVDEEEVSRLLGQGGGALALEDPAVLEDLLTQARQELPRFQFRHAAAGLLPAIASEE